MRICMTKNLSSSSSSLPQLAKHCLDTFNGQAMPVPDLPSKVYFKLNSAVGPTRNSGGGEEYCLFIGDLGREVNDHMLFSLFKEKYPSVKNAKVRETGRDRDLFGKILDKRRVF